jgi:hypothetical protein
MAAYEVTAACETPRIDGLARDALKRVDDARGPAVGRLRQRNAGAQDAVGIEPRVHPLERDGAANQQAGAEEQQQRERDFGDDQPGAQAIAEAAAGRAAPAVAQAGLDVGARQPQRRGQAARDAAHERQRGGETERHRIDVRLLEARHVLRAPGDDGRDEPAREQQTHEGRRQRQDDAFGQQLPHDAPPAGAERRAQGDLAPARGAAGQQQVRDVAARDEQHHPDRGEQHEEPRLVVADEAVSERRRRVAQLAGILRKVVTEPYRDGLELLLRLLRRRARLQSPVDAEVVLVVQDFLRRRKRDRGPQLFAVGREIERLRHDARDQVAGAVHPGRAADDRGVAAETARPQPMAQDDDPFVPGLILLGGEGAPQQRAHAHHVEVVRGDLRADDALGRRAVGQVEAREPLRRHRLERGGSGRGIGVVAGGHG